MEKRYKTNHVLRGENNGFIVEFQRKNMVQTVWNNFVGMKGGFSRVSTYCQSKISNPLSVTIMNDHILTPEFYENSSMKKKPLITNEHIFAQIPKSSNIIGEVRDALVETIQPIVERGLLMMDRSNIFSRDTINGDDTIKEQQDNKNVILENLIDRTMDSNITCKDNNTMESQSAPYVHETEKSNDTTKDLLEIELMKSRTDINEDIFVDAESFFLVSHSDVPPKSVDKKSPMSRFSDVCLNAWNDLAGRFYYKTKSVDSEIPVKHPSYLAKKHHWKKTIAMERGRGRAKCQLRRSGVSQTRCRKERTKYDHALDIREDYETWQHIESYHIIQDDLLDSKYGVLEDIGYDVPDAAQFIKQTTSPVIFNFSDLMPVKQEQKARKQKTAKHLNTEARHVVDPLTKINNDFQKNCNSDTCNTLKDLPLVNSIDSENSFCIIFENKDSENASPKVRKNQNVKYSTTGGICYIIDPLINTDNDKMLQNDTQRDSLRLQLSSESSIDSEDNSIVFESSDNESPKICKQKMKKYPTATRYVPDPCMTLNNDDHKHCSSETDEAKRDSFRSRLPSESSIESEDSYIVFESSEHGFYVVPESEGNCMNDSVDCDTTSSYDRDSPLEEKLMNEEDQDIEESMAQMKKVNFDLTPVVHVMIKWDYAYRAARKGPWEEMARDNERFKGRINSIAAVLDPILTNQHRFRIWQERFAFQE